MYVRTVCLHVCTYVNSLFLCRRVQNSAIDCGCSLHCTLFVLTMEAALSKIFAKLEELERKVDDVLAGHHQARGEGPAPLQLPAGQSSSASIAPAPLARATSITQSPPSLPASHALALVDEEVDEYTVDLSDPYYMALVTQDAWSIRYSDAN